MLPHPYAALFPMMDKKALQELVASIRDDGLEQPIVTFEGKILDGRNRDLACANAQVKPRYVKYKGKDALGYVMRLNLTRRHLTASQRAMVAAKMANLKPGEKLVSALKKSAAVSYDRAKAPITTAMAAETLDVGTATVSRAKKVLKSGDQDLIDAVEQGEVTVGVAAKGLKPSPASPTQVTPGSVSGKKLFDLWGKTDKQGKEYFMDKIAVKYLGG